MLAIQGTLGTFGDGDGASKAHRGHASDVVEAAQGGCEPPAAAADVQSKPDLA